MAYILRYWVLDLPLTYLICPELHYTDEQITSWVESVDPSHEAILMSTITLNCDTPEIAQDNLQLHTLLAPLVHDIDAYASVDAVHCKQDGRGLWMTLTEKGKGVPNRTACRWAAQAVLSKARLDKSNCGISQQHFDNFVHLTTRVQRVRYPMPSRSALSFVNLESRKRTNSANPPSLD